MKNKKIEVAISIALILVFIVCFFALVSFTFYLVDGYLTDKIESSCNQ